MRTTQLRNCPDCERYLEDHLAERLPRIPRIAEQHLTRSGWEHTTHRGMMLHRVATKQCGLE